MEKEEMERLKIIIEEGVEKELKKMKEKHIKDNLAAIKDDQNDILDEKSKPIRQYLLDNLVPILTDGLIETCKLQPDDPVDSLAEFLFRKSLDVPYPDPCSYIEWARINHLAKAAYNLISSISNLKSKQIYTSLSL